MNSAKCETTEGRGAKLAIRKKTQERYLKIVMDYKSGMDYYAVLEKHRIGATTFAKAMKWFAGNSISINQGMSLIFAIENKREELLRLKHRRDMLEELLKVQVRENFDKEGAKILNSFNVLTGLEKLIQSIEQDQCELLNLYGFARQRALPTPTGMPQLTGAVVDRREPDARKN